MPGSGVLISRCQFDRYVRALSPNSLAQRSISGTPKLSPKRWRICSGSAPMPWKRSNSTKAASLDCAVAGLSVATGGTSSATNDTSSGISPPRFSRCASAGLSADTNSSLSTSLLIRFSGLSSASRIFFRSRKNETSAKYEAARISPGRSRHFWIARRHQATPKLPETATSSARGCHQYETAIPDRLELCARHPDWSW